VKIYSQPVATEALDQGDLIDNCPIVEVAAFDLDRPNQPLVECAAHRAVVLTQTCDLANQKTQRATVALVYEAQQLVEQGLVKASDVRGPIRSGRVFGWYFLPSHRDLGLEESVVDLRQVHTIPLAILHALCQAGHRRARIEPLFREHLAKHFADTFSRIGLPLPYETE
jgi:hypothetical protein